MHHRDIHEIIGKLSQALEKEPRNGAGLEGITLGLFEIGTREAFEAFLYAAEKRQAMGIRGEDYISKMQAYAIGRIKENRYITQLTETLGRNSDPETRRMAAWALGQLRDNQSEEILLRAMDREENEMVHRRIIAELVNMRSKKAYPYFKSLVQNDPDPIVRRRALVGIEVLDLSWKRKERVDILIRTMGERHPLVTIQARHSLVSRFRGTALPEIHSALYNPDKNVRRYAIRALGEIGDNSSLKFLRRYRKDAQDVIVEAKKSIRRIIEKNRKMGGTVPRKLDGYRVLKSAI